LADTALPIADKPTAQEAPTRRTRGSVIPREDHEDLIQSFIDRIETAKEERQEWIQKRLGRYAKLRGWLEDRDQPWSNASNQHIPIMLANKLRVDAGMFNAVLGIRPVMQSTPTRLEHREQAENIDHLLDHQIFVEYDGDRAIEKYIDQFTTDGTVFSTQPWVKEMGTIYDTRIISRPEAVPAGMVISSTTLDALVEDQIGKQGFKALNQLDDAGYRWEGIYDDKDKIERTCQINVYDRAEEDEKIDVVFEWNLPVFEGPVTHVLDLEDVVAPMRSENLQPVSSINPTGAPWVAKYFRVDIDSIKRRKKQGIYDLLTQEDIDDLEATGDTRVEMPKSSDSDEEIKTQRDEQTGLDPAGSHDEDRVWHTGVEYYGRYDLNKDGLDEDVIFWFLPDQKKLCRIRALTEICPGLPPTRPFSEARFIPIPGQLYGMGMPELMEGLHDLLHTLVNQNIDYGSLSTLPFFGYRPTGGLKPESIMLEPGLGIPLARPQEDLAFYQLPGRDQGWHFNMIGLGMQFLEKLVQVSPLQFGQVPKGQASALRTSGTTQAILQQGAAMPEQILRRLFLGLRQIWQQFHTMNCRFLPPMKRYQVTGKPLNSEEAYGVIDDRKDINIPVAFDFQATLLNTNKGVVADALTGLGQAIFSPLAMQFGLVDAEKFYNWARDYIKSNQLDPARYINRPPAATNTPKITADEAILAVSEGRLPIDTQPLEPLEQHVQRLQEFAQSDEFGLLYGGRELLFREYMNHINQLVQSQQQQQMQMQAAQQFGQQMGQGGQGGTPTTVQAPPMQTEQGTADELAGASGGGGMPGM